MTKRGRILRDPSLGPGLVMVDGQQYRFALERIWKSEVLPRPGLAVEVDFDSRGEVSAISAVPEHRAEVLRWLAVAALSIGWFALGIARVDGGILGSRQLTFWELLAYVGGASAGGLLRALAILCLAGSLLPHFWADARAHLADFLPLAFMALVAVLAAGPAIAEHILLRTSPALGALPAALAGLYLAAAGARGMRSGPSV